MGRRPHVLIGTSTTADNKAKTFTKEVIQEMATINEKPVVFALSGRHSVSSADEKQECTAKEAYEWSDGRATFVGGALEGELPG